MKHMRTYVMVFKSFFTSEVVLKDNGEHIAAMYFLI